MKAAALDERITIQSATWAKSATGADVPTWGTFAEVWAAVRIPRGRGRETFDGGRDNAERWFEVEIRRLSGVEANMRILWTSVLLGSLVLDIRAVEPPVDRAANLFLKCRVIE